MGFDAGTAVDKLDYDFTAFGGEKGTIPEPSDKAVTTWIKETRKAMAEVSAAIGSVDPNTATPADMQKIMEAMDNIDYQKINEAMKKATAKLCQNDPSKEQLDKLPYRVVQAFVAWLQGELNPESSSVGTKA